MKKTLKLYTFRLLWLLIGIIGALLMVPASLWDGSVAFVNEFIEAWKRLIKEMKRGWR